MKEIELQATTDVRIRKPKRYWQNLENVRSELDKFMQTYGVDNFPTRVLLQELGEMGLLHGIKQTGGFPYWRKEFGFAEMPYKGKTVVDRYWSNPENIELELRKTIEILGHYPSDKELKEMDRTSLGRAISKVEGTNFWRERLGFPVFKRNNGYLSDDDKVQREIERVIGEHNLADFPTQSELNDLGEFSLAQAISKTGGFSQWRVRIGFEIRERPKKFWLDPNTIIDETRKFLDDNNLEDLPTSRILSSLGYTALDVAIHRHFPGGLRALREQLGLSPLRKPRNFWNENTIESEILTTVHEHGLNSIPTIRWLRDHDYKNLADAISSKYLGGMYALREKLGISDGRIALEEKVSPDQANIQLGKLMEVNS